MASVQTTGKPSVRISINDNDDNEVIHLFKWKSFSNDGYIINARFPDPYLGYLENFGLKEYISKGRKEPVEVSFDIGWVGLSEKRTSYLSGERTKAIITDLYVHGVAQNAEVEFIAIDPPSYYLNSGDSDGGVYDGKISEVIKAVVEKYAPKVTAKVDDTTDNNKNQWWMMRQDPKTFIKSLLEWSSPTTVNQTTWYIVSDSYNIHLKELKQTSGEEFTYIMINNNDDINDVVDFKLLTSSFLSNYQSILETSGISAVTGQYIDKEINEEKSVVDDDNTPNKINTINNERNLGFSKPTTRYSTHILSVPEFNGGDLGINYQDYIDGKARGTFVDMLNLVMRAKITIHGDYRINSSVLFNSGVVNIIMFKPDNEPYFMAGRWLIYGFEHRVSVYDGNWLTDLWLYRIDYDSNAKPV